KRPIGCFERRPRSRRSRGSIGGRMRRLLVAALAGVLLVPLAAGSSAQASKTDCTALEPATQGPYRRSDSAGVRLTLGRCTFSLALRGERSQGDYTVTSRGGSSGTILVSHDNACVGEENYPTSYGYAFTRGGNVLRLTLADASD